MLPGTAKPTNRSTSSPVYGSFTYPLHSVLSFLDLFSPKGDIFHGCQVLLASGLFRGYFSMSSRCFFRVCDFLNKWLTIQ